MVTTTKQLRGEWTQEKSRGYEGVLSGPIEHPCRILPHSYLTNKIVSGNKGWKDVWNLIYGHYGVKVTSESLLDFESMHKQPGETHRQFYMRLLQHFTQHLAPADVKVEQVRNAVADKMSISLMNMTALQWLMKTDQSLIDIVRTEYPVELRHNTQLSWFQELP